MLRNSDTRLKHNVELAFREHRQSKFARGNREKTR